MLRNLYFLSSSRIITHIELILVLITFSILCGDFSVVYAQTCGCTLSFDTSVKTNVYLNGGTTPVNPGDVICFQAGVYSTIRLVNIHGTQENPIIVKNCGGVAEIDLRGGTNHGFIVNNSTNFHITGTGENSEQYGFKIYREPTDIEKTAIAISDRISDIELDHIEIHDVELGVHLLNVPECDPATWRENWTMENVSIHDFYIHDVGNEGFYIGSSKYKDGHPMTCNGESVSLLPPLIKHIKVYNNRIENSGWDAMQVSVATEDVRIFNNIAINWGMKNKPSQRAGLVIGGGSTGEVFNNYIDTGEGDGIDVFGIGDVRIFNNIVVGAKGQGIFIGNREPFTGYNYYLVNNTIVDSGEDAIRYNNEFSVGSKIINNLLVNSGQKDINLLKQGSGGVTVSSNLSLATVNEAKFTDPGNRDYSLAFDSPAVNQGEDISSMALFYTDFFGIPRPNDDTIDVGAAEYSLDSNKAPKVINHIANQIIFLEKLFELELAVDTFVDPEGDPFSLSAAQVDNSPLPNWLSFNPIGASFTGTPDKENVGMIQVKVTAIDTHGAANSDFFKLQIISRSKISPLYLSLPAILNSSKYLQKR